MRKVLLALAALTRPRRKPQPLRAAPGLPQRAKHYDVYLKDSGLKAEDLTLPLWADDLKKLLDETG
jgi:hypothetical protein